jgi:hypothetical protein
MTDVGAVRGPARPARRHPSLAHLRRPSRVVVGALTMMLVGAMALAPQASANPPVSTPAPIGNVTQFPAGTACSFNLQGELIGGNQVLTTFDDGRFLATGRHIDRITNLDTGKAITLDLNGVLSVVPTADGGSVVRAVGVTGYTFSPGDAGPGDNQIGRFYVFTGYFVVVSDANFVVTSFKSYGTSKDVCAMLT